MNYSVTGEQLTRIASAIRDKKGLNLFDPTTGIAYVHPSVKYTISKTITYDGSSVPFISMYLVYDANNHRVGGGMIAGPENPPSAGTTERVYTSDTMPNNACYIKNSTTSHLTDSNIQVERGNSMTTFAEFQPLEFPDEFVSAIQSI